MSEKRRGSIRADRNFPRRLVNVLDPEGHWLMGTPFAVLSEADLRAWAAAFLSAAEAIPSGICDVEVPRDV